MMPLLLVLPLVSGQDLPQRSEVQVIQLAAAVGDGGATDLVPHQGSEDAVVGRDGERVPRMNAFLWLPVLLIGIAVIMIVLQVRKKPASAPARKELDKP